MEFYLEKVADTGELVITEIDALRSGFFSKRVSSTSLM